MDMNVSICTRNSPPPPTRKADAMQTTTTPVITAEPVTAHRITTGPALMKLLKAHGIDANSITRNRRTGVYVVKFAAVDMSNFYAVGTDSWQTWRDRILDVLPDAELDLHGCYDSAAEWRPQQPILFATVTLRLPEYVQVAA